jgi:hypothetical protein
MVQLKAVMVEIRNRMEADGARILSQYSVRFRSSLVSSWLTNHQYALCDIKKQRIPHFQRGGSLTHSQSVWFFFLIIWGWFENQLIDCILVYLRTPFQFHSLQRFFKMLWAILKDLEGGGLTAIQVTVVSAQNNKCEESSFLCLYLYCRTCGQAVWIGVWGKLYRICTYSCWETKPVRSGVTKHANSPGKATRKPRAVSVKNSAYTLGEI